MKRTHNRSPVERVMDMVVRDGDCWVFTGFIDTAPRLRVGGRSIDARTVFHTKTENGKRMRLMKTCGNVACINPSHNLNFHSIEADFHRFWQNVSVKSDDECWNWTGNSRPDSYGAGARARFTPHDSKPTYAYRWLMGQLEGGLDDKIVLHKCDNGLCVNPSHLALGTQQDNVDDMISKWRHMHGESHTSAVLNDDVIKHIRSRWGAGETQKSIALDLGVNKVTVWAAVHRKTWRHVD